MTTEAPVDLLTLGRRIRHLREARRLTHYQPPRFNLRTQPAIPRKQFR